MIEAEKRKNDLATWFIFVSFGMSGAAALIYEVVWTRSLSTVMGSSTYALSTMLSAFMAGLAIGGWLGARLAPRIRRLPMAYAGCQLGIGLAGLLSLPAIKALMPLYMKLFYAFHLSFEKFSAVQFGVIFLIMIAPTTLMGITFPLVVKIFAAEGRDAATQAGHLYCVNTFGAIAGSAAAGFFLIPALGTTATAIAAASINLFIAAGIYLLAREIRKLAVSAALVLAGAAGAAAIDKPHLPIWSFYNTASYGSFEMASKVFHDEERSGEGSVLFHHEGVDGDVSLIKHDIHGSSYDLALVNNGKRETGNDLGFALLAYIPFFSHPGGGPQNALSIGLGSGHTLAHLSGLPLAHIDSVELSEGILQANRLFLRPELFDNPRISHIKADGRNYMLLARQAYDIIIVSPSWAVEMASAGLLTDEAFSLAAARLSEKGICAVWVDYFMMNHEDLQVLARTFSRHFAHAVAWYVEGDTMILAGSNAPLRHPTDTIAAAIERYEPELAGRFYVAISEEMMKKMPEGGINTDDRPVIEFDNARNAITWREGGF